MASVTGAKSEEAGRHSTPGRTPRGKARAPWWCKPLESPAGQDGGSVRQRFFNSVFHSFWGWPFPGPRSCCPAHFAIGSRERPCHAGMTEFTRAGVSVGSHVGVVRPSPLAGLTGTVTFA